MAIGGFKSGFHAQKVPRSQAKWEQFLICNHDCSEIIQLVSHVSGEVEFELCQIEAARMGQVLLAAAGSLEKNANGAEGDISDKTGEGSITFHYAGQSLPGGGSDSEEADHGHTLAGYIEGGNNKAYRGRINIVLLPNEQTEVSVKKPFLSIL
ncbi:hypothetical protein [Brevibacillus borstelensis]|uniref:hypothetical protein n=1 Tax=Brevibacillus borstelensis TaxID=45462 RepID=UPI0030BCDF0F